MDPKHSVIKRLHSTVFASKENIALDAFHVATIYLLISTFQEGKHLKNSP